MLTLTVLSVPQYGGRKLPGAAGESRTVRMTARCNCGKDAAFATLMVEISDACGARVRGLLPDTPRATLKAGS